MNMALIPDWQIYPLSKHFILQFPQDWELEVMKGKIRLSKGYDFGVTISTYKLTIAPNGKEFEPNFVALEGIVTRQRAALMAHGMEPHTEMERGEYYAFQEQKGKDSSRVTVAAAERGYEQGKLILSNSFASWRTSSKYGDCRRQFRTPNLFLN